MSTRCSRIGIGWTYSIGVQLECAFRHRVFFVELTPLSSQCEKRISVTTSIVVDWNQLPWLGASSWILLFCGVCGLILVTPFLPFCFEGDVGFSHSRVS